MAYFIYTGRKKNRALTACFLLTGLTFFLSCQPVPITGRRQLALVPESQLLAISFEQYENFIDSAQVITGTENSKLVQRVGTNIQKAVQRYFRENPQRLKNYRWEFNLIADSNINAFAMPGGKVAVFTGMLPVTQNEAGMAFVLAHEVAHAVAQHGNERMSQLLLAQLGGIAIDVALRDHPQLTRQLALAAFGIGAQVGILLPFSRLHESEADRLGLVFMAMAGYDPRGAIDMWQRMIEARKGPQPPEFLSTHPAGENRIENMKEMMPEALEYYNQR